MNVMTEPKKSPCRCTNCGAGCGKDKHAAPTEEPKPKPLGFLEARPWIWIVVGYVAMVACLGVMVTIAIRNQQPDVLVTRGH